MPSFGETLRRERESRRIALRDVAESTKINMRYLEALESNDFRHLPGGVFNKGFVRAYAQYIGVDPEHLIEAYLAEEASHAPAPAADAGDGSRHPTAAVSGPRTGLKILVGLAVVLAVVAAAVVGAWMVWGGGGGR